MNALTVARRLAAQVVEAARGAKDIVVFASVNGHAQAVVKVAARPPPTVQLRGRENSR